MTFSFSNFSSSAVNLLIHSVIQLCSTTAQAFLWSIHATARFVCQFLIIPLSQSSWSLVPFFRFGIPSAPLLADCFLPKIYTVTMNSPQSLTSTSVGGRRLILIFNRIAFFFESFKHRYVFPFVGYSGSCSLFGMLLICCAMSSIWVANQRWI